MGSFDTNADRLFLTDMHVEAYLLKSRGIVKRFINSRNRKPGRREIPVKYSSALLSSEFGFNASDVPPAGFLLIQSDWWQRDPAKGRRVSVGPKSGGGEFDIIGKPGTPQRIEFAVHKPAEKVDWVIKHTNAPSIPAGKGLSKKKTRNASKPLAGSS